MVRPRVVAFCYRENATLHVPHRICPIGTVSGPDDEEPAERLDEEPDPSEDECENENDECPAAHDIPLSELAHPGLRGSM